MQDKDLIIPAIPKDGVAGVPAEVNTGELAQLWEDDALLESLILEEENKRLDSELPQWVLQMF